MSNFMPLGQLITDLINTLLLAILKLTAGRVSVFVCVCGGGGSGSGGVEGTGLFFSCAIEKQARAVVSMCIHPSNISV